MQTFNGKMTEKNFPECKLGFYGNMTRSFPLLLEETRHLVYMFCDREKSRKGRKHRCKRSYCSLCRHFHKETDNKEGIEKYFAPEIFKVQSAERNGQVKLQDNANDLHGNDLFASKEKGCETLTVEGLKMYKVTNKTSQKSVTKKETFNDAGNLQKAVSARNGCITCEKRRDSLMQSQEASKSNKRIIRIVMPSTDSKSRLSSR